MPHHNGWTGGQYSLYRVILGGAVAVRFGPEAFGGLSFPGSMPFLAGTLFTVPLMLGAGDRVAAIALAGLLLFAGGVAEALHSPGTLALIAALTCHASLPPAPYGSWSARGRSDPGAGWRMPDATATGVGFILALLYAFQALIDPVSGIPMWLRLAAALAFGTLWIAPRYRAGAWIGMLLLELVLPHLIPGAGLSGGLVALHLLAFDPSWIRPRNPGALETMFYDGHCGLCHRAVRFVIAEDREGAAYHFSPIGSVAFLSEVPPAARPELPDSVIVRSADGRLLVRSEAILHIGKRLGGIWRALSGVVGLIPAALRDAGYDAIARIRKRVFRAPKDSCPVVPAELRGRFDL